LAITSCILFVMYSLFFYIRKRGGVGIKSLHKSIKINETNDNHRAAYLKYTGLNT
jgi:hypothetical protein